MHGSFRNVTIVALILLALSTGYSESMHFITPGQPEFQVSGAVHDYGKVFGGKAKSRAQAALRRIQHDHGITVVIETFESLRGQTIDDVARRRPRPFGHGGIHVLVIGREREVTLRTFHAGAVGGTPDQRDAILQAFLAPLRAGDPDLALERGIRAIEAIAARSAASGTQPGPGLVASVVYIAGAMTVLLAIRRWRRLRDGRRMRRRTPSGIVDATRGGLLPARVRLTFDRFESPRSGDHSATPPRRRRARGASRLQEV